MWSLDLGRPLASWAPTDRTLEPDWTLHGLHVGKIPVSSGCELARTDEASFGGAAEN